MFSAKEASPSANATNREEFDSLLLSILHQHPNSTKKQIGELLEKDYDKKLTLRGGLQYHLSAFIRDGKIISEKSKSGNVYSVVDSDPQSLVQNQYSS